MSDNETIKAKNLDHQINWWNIVSGVLLIILGIVILNNISGSSVVIFRTFGIYMIIKGIITIINNVKLRKESKFLIGARGNIVLGVLQIIAGIVLTSNPGMTMSIFTNIAAIYFIADAISSIVRTSVFVWPFRKSFATLQIVIDVLVIIAAIMLLGNGLVGGLTVTIVIGIGAICIGAVSLIDGFF